MSTTNPPPPTGPERKSLGRGLSALLPGAAGGTTSVTGNAVVSGPFAFSPLRLPTEKIRTRPEQPRKNFDAQGLEELSRSIREKGILQPLLVQKSDNGQDYLLIAGERRLRAAILAGLKDVPVIIRRIDNSSAKSAAEERLELALIENIQRQDLSPIEEAAAYLQLIQQYGLSQEEVAQKVGKSRPAVANSLRLLKLPAVVQGYLTSGALTVGQVRPLLALDDSSKIEAMAEAIRTQGLNARQVESQARSQSSKHLSRGATKRVAKSDPTSLHLRAVKDDLQTRLGTRVDIQANASGAGTLTLHFFSSSDLNRLLALLDARK